jgi:transketolase
MSGGPAKAARARERLKDGVHGPAGYSTGLRLTNDELARVRALIEEHWLGVIRRHLPDRARDFAALGMARYHELAHLLDHAAAWPKRARILPAAAAAEIRRMPFMRQLAAEFGAFEISDEDDFGCEEIYFRLVRPGQRDDMGPLHADRWFWDLGHGTTPPGVERVKVWVAIVCEPGRNGLRVVPGSHRRQWRYHGEPRHGMMKPVFDEDESRIGAQLLETRPGDAVVFNDGLLHGGAANAGETTRVSFEFTMFVRESPLTPLFQRGGPESEPSSPRLTKEGIRGSLDASHLGEIARRVRAHVVTMSHRGRSPHLGSSLSCIDILVAAYFGALHIDPRRAGDPDRDRFILSKGHAAPALYATLARRGFFGLDLLDSYNRDGAVLAEQPSPGCVPGLEAATGSLGHGLSLGVGMALAGRIQSRDYRVFALLSDGECNEGSVWEAAMFAAAQRLERVCAVVDYNRWQATGRSDEIMALAPLAEKWRAFGWTAHEVDGHDIDALCRLFGAVPDGSGRPVAVIAHTVKGKGVSFMEDDNNWHYRIPNEEELAAALRELEA